MEERTKSLLQSAFKAGCLAVIHIDLQKEFCEASNLFAFINAQTLARSTRANGIENIWVVYGDQYKDAEKVRDFNPRRPESEFHIVRPAPKELVFSKNLVDAFWSDPLKKYLKDKGITTVIFTGVNGHETGCYTNSVYGFAKWRTDVNSAIIAYDAANIDPPDPGRYLRKLSRSLKPRGVDPHNLHTASVDEILAALDEVA